MSNYRNLLENWNKFLTEEETLDEVTEEELSNIDDILHNLDPQDLSFNNIFGDRMRIIEPMKTKDQDLESLKKLLTDSGYEPNFQTGLATYHTMTYDLGQGSATPGKTETRIIGTDLKDHLLDKNGEPARLFTDTDESFEERKKKIQKKQIKIGKLLQKGARLYNNAREAWTASDTINPEDFGISPDGDDDDDIGEKTDQYRAAAGDMLDKSKKEHQKLFNVFQADTSRAVSAFNMYQKLAEWWNKKSAFYRENPEETETTDNNYSIIYTRHPLDVMRMSDFENMTSCHSPPSRPSDSGNSFYKCAVAEAQGHGPVAYVVRNTDLNDWISSSAQSFEGHQEFLDFIEESDEEFFMDTERGTGEISPISRVRLKKFVNPTLEISLAVPSSMTYGKRFPDLYNNISEFAKEKQAEELTKIKDSSKSDNPFDSAFNDDGKFNLANWERFGGSYQDAGDYPSEAIHKWLGYKTTGNTHYDEDTEDNLNVQGNREVQWQLEVNEIQNGYNRRMDAISIAASVEDDGAGEYYIDVNASFKLSFDESKFTSTGHTAYSDKTRLAIEALPDHLQQYGFDWLKDYSSYTTINHNNADWADMVAAAIDNIESAIVVDIPVDIEVVNPEESGYAYDPDNFRDICQKISQADDQADAVQEIAESYLKREGVMEGGGLHKLAAALEDENWYEWDYGIDDEYAPTQIELETKVYVNFQDLIKQIPITFDHQPDKSSEVFIMFAGDPLALASRRDDGEGNFVDFEVRSPEFDNDRMDGFKSMDAIKEYAQWNVANMILRPKSGMLGKVMGGTRKGEATRDYSLVVRTLMREEAGGEEGEFMYPKSSMWVDGPDGEDDYKMMFMMHLDDDDPDAVASNALDIMRETDNEDLLTKIFRTAFAKAAKIPNAPKSLTEVKQYFGKFNIF